MDVHYKAIDKQRYRQTVSDTGRRTEKYVCLFCRSNRTHDAVRPIKQRLTWYIHPIEAMYLCLYLMSNSMSIKSEHKVKRKLRWNPNAFHVSAL
jgi:hypothetical protein